jgi:hypothetical protein
VIVSLTRPDDAQATAADAERFLLPLPFLTMKFDYALVPG